MAGRVGVVGWGRSGPAWRRATEQAVIGIIGLGPAKGLVMPLERIVGAAGRGGVANRVAECRVGGAADGHAERIVERIDLERIVALCRVAARWGELGRCGLVHGELVVADAELVAVGKDNPAITRRRLTGPVDVDPVGAEVGQNPSPVLDTQHAMRLGQVALGIRQHPIVALTTANR